MRFRGAAVLAILEPPRLGSGESPELGAPLSHSGRRKGASFQPSDRLAGFFPGPSGKWTLREGWHGSVTLFPTFIAFLCPDRKHVAASAIFFRVSL